MSDFDIRRALFFLCLLLSPLFELLSSSCKKENPKALPADIHDNSPSLKRLRLPFFSILLVFLF